MKNLFIALFILTGFTMNAQGFPPPPEVMLIGKHTFAELISSEDYKWFMEKAAIADTNGCNECKDLTAKKKFKFAVVCGTWCSDTQDLLPLFYDVLGTFTTDIDKVVDLYFVDRDKAKPAEVVIKFEVKSIPVFILYDKDNKEVGRITESVKVSMKDDIVELLKKLK